MSFSINRMLPNYQSTCTGSLYRSVDRNHDNTYSRQEVGSFAALYEKSTGKSIDADGLFEAYDVDLDGALSGAEYKKVMADDALNMDVLYGAKRETNRNTEKASDKDMSSWLNSLSNTQKMSLVRSTFRAKTTGNLLSAMFGSANLFAGARSSGMFGMGNVLMQYGNARHSSYASRISSLNLLV